MLRDLVLDGYEQTQGVWVDSTGNPLTYLPWCGSNPSDSMQARYLGIWSGCNEAKPFDDDFGTSYEFVYCVKCSSKYAVPYGYSCLETDFGLMIIKAYGHKVTATEARRLCAADADYVHLPIPQNGAQNSWYENYAKKLGLDKYWLGISDDNIGGVWKTDKGDLQTYLPWRPGSQANHNYAYVQAYVGGWRKSDDAENTKFFAICSYIIAGTAP